MDLEGAVGGDALARHGIHDVISPPLRFDSEALLELPQLTDVNGRRVIIFRGDGGRELLGETLAARGASVEYVSCYRRGRPLWRGRADDRRGHGAVCADRADRS